MTTTTTPTATDAAQPKVYTFGFTDRASYLAYRKEWRKSYRAISVESRTLKRSITLLRGDPDASPLQSRLMSVKVKATEMLAERVASKVEAGRQFNIVRAAEQFAAKLAAA